MSKKYKPQWFKSAFDFAEYTLIRDLKHCKHLDIEKKLISIGETANATTNFIINDNGQNRMVIYMPYSDVDLIFKQGLVIHECVHIWQEIKEIMNEKNPSSEFEAYSVQCISQDMLYLLGESEKYYELEKPTN